MSVPTGKGLGGHGTFSSQPGGESHQGQKANRAGGVTGAGSCGLPGSLMSPYT
mgnify:CR=1 FL=1